MADILVDMRDQKFVLFEQFEIGKLTESELYAEFDTEITPLAAIHNDEEFTDRYVLLIRIEGQSPEFHRKASLSARSGDTRSPGRPIPSQTFVFGISLLRT